MTLDRIIMPDIEKLIKELSIINSTRRKKSGASKSFKFN